MAELYIGLISGTSADGIDAALVDLSGDRPKLLHALNHAYDDDTRQSLLALNDSRRSTVAQLAHQDVLLARRFAAAVESLLEPGGIGARQIRAIGCHGHTVAHQTEGDTPFTLQIGDPNVLAELTGITTVADFRRRDIAAGGQGAPLAPAFHELVLRDPNSDRIAVNMGGIANITVLPADKNRPVIGFDTGPANALMDLWCQKHTGERYDRDGAWGAGGKPIQALLDAWLADGWFKISAPKSTHRDYFDFAWIEAGLSKLSASPKPEDVQASLRELSALSVADAIAEYAPGARGVFVCGGGASNARLMQSLAEAMPERNVASTAEHGIDPDWMEAMCFAWLAQRTVESKPGNLPSVTGASHSVILGGIYQA